MKNRKGDIPITILVILVAAICVLAILSFLNSKDKVQSNYLGLDAFEELNSDVEKYYFYLNADYSREDAAEEIGADIEGGTLVLDKIRKSGDEIIVSIHYVTNIDN